MAPRNEVCKSNLTRKTLRSFTVHRMGRIVVAILTMHKPASGEKVLRFVPARARELQPAQHPSQDQHDWRDHARQQHVGHNHSRILQLGYS